MNEDKIKEFLAFFEGCNTKDNYDLTELLTAFSYYVMGEMQKTLVIIEGAKDD